MKKRFKGAAEPSKVAPVPKSKGTDTEITERAPVKDCPKLPADEWIIVNGKKRYGDGRIEELNVIDAEFVYDSKDIAVGLSKPAPCRTPKLS